MGIMPFGCRCFAVKPRSFISKTELDTRAWVGINGYPPGMRPGIQDVVLLVLAYAIENILHTFKLCRKRRVAR